MTSYLIICVLGTYCFAIFSIYSLAAKLRGNEEINPQYLLKFKNKNQLDKEIEKLENIRLKAHEMYNYIQHFKYVNIYFANNEKNNKKIEIEPSIIDSYNLRSLEIKPINTNNCYRETEITSECLYRSILNTHKGDGIRYKILFEENVVENIYKIYIHRRQLEIEYLELMKELEYEDKMNLDEVTKEINKKLEMLYERLGNLYRS
jgi:hypothetical protein